MEGELTEVSLGVVHRSGGGGGKQLEHMADCGQTWTCSSFRSVCFSSFLALWSEPAGMRIEVISMRKRRQTLLCYCISQLILQVQQSNLRPFPLSPFGSRTQGQAGQADGG